jgi:hypothetical protein
MGRSKKKTNSGERNGVRPNGKAWKRGTKPEQTVIDQAQVAHDKSVRDKNGRSNGEAV